MKRLIGLSLLACVPSIMGGCVSLFTTVDLVNNASNPVHVIVYYDANAGVSESALLATGQKREFDIQAGATASFMQDCAIVKAVVVQGQMSVPGGPALSTTSQVVRESTDFIHGDTLVFTLTQSASPDQLNVAFSRESPPL